MMPHDSTDFDAAISLLPEKQARGPYDIMAYNNVTPDMAEYLWDTPPIQFDTNHPGLRERLQTGKFNDWKNYGGGRTDLPSRASPRNFTNFVKPDGYVYGNPEWAQDYTPDSYDLNHGRAGPAVPEYNRSEVANNSRMLAQYRDSHEDPYGLKALQTKSQPPAAPAAPAGSPSASGYNPDPGFNVTPSGFPPLSGGDVLRGNGIAGPASVTGAPGDFTQKVRSLADSYNPDNGLPGYGLPGGAPAAPPPAPAAPAGAVPAAPFSNQDMMRGIMSGPPGGFNLLSGGMNRESNALPSAVGTPAAAAPPPIPKDPQAEMSQAVSNYLTMGQTGRDAYGTHFDSGAVISNPNAQGQRTLSSPYGSGSSTMLPAGAPPPSDPTLKAETAALKARQAQGTFATAPATPAMGTRGNIPAIPVAPPPAPPNPAVENAWQNMKPGGNNIPAIPGELRNGFAAANAPTGELRNGFAAANAPTGELRNGFAAANAPTGELRNGLFGGKPSFDSSKTPSLFGASKPPAAPPTPAIAAK